MHLGRCGNVKITKKYQKAKAGVLFSHPLFCLCLIFLLLTFVAMPFAAADTTSITFSDFGLGAQTIVIYNVNGTLVEETNSTSTVSLNSTHDYVFVLQPTKMNLLKDPLQAVDLLLMYIPVGFAWLLVLVVIAAILLLFRWVFR